jgi:hypothetical protein
VPRLNAHDCVRADFVLGAIVHSYGHAAGKDVEEVW